jgi:hypothetical protein
MDHAAVHHPPEIVALLCPEPRLNRLLRMVLEADGFCVRTWPGGVDLLGPDIAAVVADLDSLGWPRERVATELSAIGLDTAVTRLLISVLPAEPTQRAPTNTAYLQPPFSPREFVGRLRALLSL